MARGRLEEERERGKKKKRRTDDADGQCRLVYQNGIVGAIVALLDTPFVGYIQALREPGTTQSFLSFTLRDSFHFSSLALTPPRNKNRAGGGDEGRGVQKCRRAVSPLRSPRLSL